MLVSGAVPTLDLLLDLWLGRYPISARLIAIMTFLGYIIVLEGITTDRVSPVEFLIRKFYLVTKLIEALALIQNTPVRHNIICVLHERYCEIFRFLVFAFHATLN